MTARGCQGKQAVNVVQFPRDVKLTPSCSQCRIPMVIMRAEPAPNKDGGDFAHLSMYSVRTERAENDELDADE
jgi:hypothetical protein